jgi:hypothetical protein
MSRLWRSLLGYRNKGNSRQQLCMQIVGVDPIMISLLSALSLLLAMAQIICQEIEKSPILILRIELFNE